VVSRSSILDDDAVVHLISERILELAKMFLQSGHLQPSAVLSKLGLQTISLDDFNKLRNEVEALEVRLEEMSRENEKWRLAYESLATRPDLSREVEILRAKVRDSNREKNRWRNESETLETKTEETERKHTSELASVYSAVLDVVDQVEDTLEVGDVAWSWVNDDSDPLEALEERVNYLINEYEALAAEVEEHG
jgi:DNA repair exonuclease SbcCD ATPase subunit